MNFTGTHWDFLASEFSITEETFDSMSADEKEDLYERVCDIEIDESCAAKDKPLSECGQTAVEIVNIMAKALGYEKAS